MMTNIFKHIIPIVSAFLLGGFGCKNNREERIESASKAVEGSAERVKEQREDVRDEMKDVRGAQSDVREEQRDVAVQKNELNVAEQRFADDRQTYMGIVQERLNQLDGKIELLRSRTDAKSKELATDLRQRRQDL